MNLNEHCYVPRLLIKAGEMKALLETNNFLSSEKRKTGHLFPLLVIPDIDWDYENGHPSDTPSSFISKKKDQIIKNWPRPAFIDAASVVTDPTDSNQPLSLIDTAFHQFGARYGMIPVLHDLSTSSDAYSQVQSLIRAGLCHEVCLRLQNQEWLVLAEKSNFISWIQGLNLSENNCHIILDLESSVEESSYTALGLVLFATLIRSYHSLDFTILGTSVPESPKIPSGMEKVDRREWNNWLTIIKREGGERPSLPIAFGDYGTVGLGQSVDIDPRIMNISGKFKYTTDDSWLLGKGGLFKGTKGRDSMGGKAIIPIIDAIVHDPQFRRNHCPTDDWMYEISAGTSTRCGNPTTWISEAMLHHMISTLEQIGSL